MDVIPNENLPAAAMAWGKDMTNWRRETQRQLDRNETQNTLSQLNASVQLLSRQVAALPVPQVQSSTVTNWGVNGASGFLTKSSVTFIMPPGKTNVQLQATGGVGMLDTTSGGLAVASSRITINGISSAVFQASKDAGASVVNNIISPSFGGALVLAPGTLITVNLDVSATNPTAYPTSTTNYAALTVLAIFTP